MNQNKPAIVVAAYNRPHSLNRILHSLAKSVYSSDATLVISIDKSKSDNVLQVATDFAWQHGEKLIIHHPENLGLKKHILACGDLTRKYGSIILLEDDLYVSPHFYAYACEALAFYKDERQVAGISLFSHGQNVHVKLPFIPLRENADNFFMQLPSSWGQAWSLNQWTAFKEWFTSPGNDGAYPPARVPANIAAWPATSWLKIFSKYMIDKNKFFVYPHQSLTTNFGDTGVHFGRKFSFVQVPLQNAALSYRFAQLHDANNVYDSFFELLPSSVKTLAKHLSAYDFEVDLYGYKSLAGTGKPYYLTTQKCRKFEQSYGLDFKPMEANIIENNPGTDIFLVKAADFPAEVSRTNRTALFEYFYRMPKFGEIFQLIKLKIRQNL